jgi:hypothetical protein
MDDEAASPPPHLRNRADEDTSLISETADVRPTSEHSLVDDEIKALCAKRDALKAEQ